MFKLPVYLALTTKGLIQLNDLCVLSMKPVKVELHRGNNQHRQEPKMEVKA